MVKITDKEDIVTTDEEETQVTPEQETFETVSGEKFTPATGFEEGQVGIPGINLVPVEEEAPAEAITETAVEEGAGGDVRFGGTEVRQDIPDENLISDATDAGIDTTGKTTAQIKEELLAQKKETERLKEEAEKEEKRLADEVKATKFARDVEIAREKTEKEAKRAKEDITRQFDEAIRKGNISRNQTSNNLNLLRGQLGAATSKNATNAINSRNDEATNAINQLRSSKGRQLNLVGEELQSEIERFDRLLDDTVSKAFQDTIDLFSAADLQGKLDDIKGIQEVNTQAVAILDRLDEEIGVQLDNVDFVLAASKERADIEKEFLKNAGEINSDISFATGFLTDNNGNQLLKNGKPIQIDASAGKKVGEFTNEVEGTKTFVFRNPVTGELSERSFDIGVEPTAPTAALKPFVVSKDSFVFDPNTNTFITNPNSTNNAATVGDNQLVITAGTSNNRPDRNNNPFNVKASPINASLSTSTDDEGHLIFTNPQDGLQAGINDVTAKIEKRTSNVDIIKSMEKRLGKKVGEITQQEWIDNITISDLGSGFAEDPTWASKVAGKLGVNKETKIATLNKNNLFKAIANQEGFNGNIEVIDKAIDPDVEQWAITIMKDPAKITTVPKELKTQVNTRANELRKERGGNARYQKLKTADFGKLAQFIELGNKFNQIRELKKRVNTGPVSARVKAGKEFAGFGDEDFINLDNITGKILVEFIKEISGAAVSEQEAQRLATISPNVRMSDKRFNIAMENMISEWSNIYNSKVERFGFDNRDSLKSSVFGVENRETFSNKNALIPTSSDDDIINSYTIKTTTKSDLNDKSSDEELLESLNIK